MYACGFRIYFTPLPGFFSPFPHGTGSLSVDHEYLALEDGPPIFRQDFTCPALLVPRLVPPRAFRIRGYHPLWPDFPDRSARRRRLIVTGLLRVRSPLLAESRLISIPPGTEMFQFPGFALHAYVFSMQYGLSRGFPHSDISGSKLVCQLPEDFAGYRVLHRLLPPRHPPRTLIRLTI